MDIGSVLETQFAWLCYAVYHDFGCAYPLVEVRAQVKNLYVLQANKRIIHET